MLGILHIYILLARWSTWCFIAARTPLAFNQIETKLESRGMRRSARKMDGLRHACNEIAFSSRILFLTRMVPFLPGAIHYLLSIVLLTITVKYTTTRSWSEWFIIACDLNVNRSKYRVTKDSLKLEFEEQLRSFGQTCPLTVKMSSQNHHIHVDNL